MLKHAASKRRQRTVCWHCSCRRFAAACLGPLNSLGWRPRLLAVTASRFRGRWRIHGIGTGIVRLRKGHCPESCSAASPGLSGNAGWLNSIGGWALSEGTNCRLATGDSAAEGRSLAPVKAPRNHPLFRSKSSEYSNGNELEHHQNGWNAPKPIDRGGGRLRLECGDFQRGGRYLLRRLSGL